MKTILAILLSPLALIRLILVVLLTAFIVFSGMLWLKLFGFSRALQHWMQHNWGKYTLLICGFKLDKNQIPKNSNFILMPNHRSYIDIFIVAALTPSAMVGKAELAKWPLGKMAIKATASILVDRKNTSSLLQTMSQIKASVSKEIPVALFPEGTTFRGPLTKQFKNGSFKIAADTKIPVIPMAIEYHDKNDAWVGNDTFVGHFFRQMWRPLRKAYIRFGEPVSDTDYKNLQQEVKTRIDKMLLEIQNL